MAEIWMWFRQDGGAPKALAAKTKPPGRGEVLVIQARSSDQARRDGIRWMAIRERLGGEPSPERIEAMASDPTANQEVVDLLRSVRAASDAELVNRYGG